MSQPHYGGQWYCFKFSNTFANNIKGVERTRRRPIPKWINAAQFVFWQQSWYEVQFGKEKVEDDDVCRYYRIAGRYVFEFSWCSLPCHVLIGNRLLFSLLLILRRGGGLESCPQRGSEARYIKQDQSRLKSSLDAKWGIFRLLLSSLWRWPNGLLSFGMGWFRKEK